MALAAIRKAATWQERFKLAENKEPGTPFDRLFADAMFTSTQALALAIQTLKLSEDTLGREHPMTTTCLNDLGWMYQNLGQYTNAEPVFFGLAAS